MSKAFQIKSYLQFYRQAVTRYKVHSPFVFQLIEQVLEDDRNFYIFQSLKVTRKQLKKSKLQLTIKDLGAGSHVSTSNQRTVGAITKSAVSPEAQCQLLFRLTQYFKPKTMLEFGTSLGLSTLYQAFGNTEGQLITMEGSPEISRFAQEMFINAKAKNVQLKIGNFDNLLPEILKELNGTLDYVFFDGNHRKQPTLDYFETCLPYADNNSLFIFDDIYWSPEMKEAWETIKEHPSVTLTVDLFYMGLVFFRKEQLEDKHLKVVTQGAKPWVMGFWN